MPDLFIHPDDHYLLAKWQHLSAMFRVVTRDYQRVLAGHCPPDCHRTLIIQTVSDLLDLEVDLVRLGKDSPAAALTGRSRAVWQAAVAWVSELRAWRLPHDATPARDIERALLCRKQTEEHFTALLCDVPVDGDPDAPVVVAG